MFILRLKATLQTLILVFLLLCSNHQAAVSGDPNLDESFGAGGYNRLSFNGYPYSWNFGAFVSPFDGKITLLVDACNDFYNPCALALGRFDVNGNPDANFGVNGKLITSHFATTGGFGLPNGKFIVFGGNTNDWRNGVDFQVSRFNYDGSLDRRFAQNGTFAISLDGFSEKVVDGILLPDGKMLFIGEKDSSNPMVIFRLNSDGRLDQTFGINGVREHNYYAGNARLTLQPDGKIITQSFDRVLRFLPDGSIDPAFTSNRIFELATNYTVALGLQSDGKIVVTGKNTNEDIWMGGYGGLFMTRLNPDGTKDATFKNGGAFKTSFGKTFYGSTPDRILILPSDDILIGGHDGQSNGLALFTKDGEYISRTISRRVAPPQPGSSSGMWLLPDNKVLTAGGGVTRYKSIKYFADVNIRYNYAGIGNAEQSNLGIYRPSVGYWYFGPSTSINATLGGVPGDIPVPADYDGDNRTDPAIFRPSDGTWRTLHTTVQLGQAGDIPVPGDFDGDGRYDRAVFRPSNGVWYILLSSGELREIQFGLNGDQPLVGDFDNDGRSDVALVRRTQGQMIWYIYRSGSSDYYIVSFGLDSDIAVPFDFASDGQTDVCIFRPSTGDWWVYENLSSIYVVHWGKAGDIPAPLYYDSDSKGDFAVYRPSVNFFYVLSSQGSQARIIQFGEPGDIPIASAYVR